MSWTGKTGPKSNVDPMYEMNCAFLHNSMCSFSALLKEVLDKLHEEEKPLEVGDTVRLQSGGPLMTVLEVTKKGVRCGWFLGKDNQEGTFPAGALYKESPSWRGKKAGE